MTSDTNVIKQTVDVLLFQRFSIDEDIPEGRRIAFKDHFGNRYILKIRRYFIIDKLDELIMTLKNSLVSAYMITMMIMVREKISKDWSISSVHLKTSVYYTRTTKTMSIVLLSNQ